MKKFLFLIKREFQLLKKNNLLKLVLIGGPFMFAILLGMVYQKARPTELSIQVVDLDNSPLSQKVIDALDDNQYLKVEKVAPDVFMARYDFEKGHVEGVVTIPSSFENDVQQKRHPIVQLDLNTTNILTSNYINTGVMTVMGVIQAGTDIQILQMKGFTPELAQQQYTSMGLNVTRHYNRENNYLKFLWPGIIGAILQQIFLMVIALIFTQEFEKGSFRQLLNYSKSSSYLIFTKSTGYFLYMFVIWNILLYIVFPAFKIDIIGDYFSVMVVSVAFMFTLLAMGIFVSVLVRTQIMATDVLMIMSAPSFIISGFTWPVSQMNHFMQVVAEILPLTHFLSAYRKVLFMGVSWMDVMPELTKLGIMIVGYGLLSWAILKWKIYRTLKREPEYSE